MNISNVMFFWPVVIKISWTEQSTPWHRSSSASHPSRAKNDFHTGTVNLHQFPRLCPCSCLCSLNNSSLVYFNPQEIRVGSYPCRPTQWVAAQHSRVTSPSSLQGDLRAGDTVSGGFEHRNSTCFPLDDFSSAVCFHFICCMCVHVCVCSPSLWCHDEWAANKAEERRRERRGEEKRSLVCLFIALFHHGNHLIYSEHFSIHLLLSLAKPIFYLHQCRVHVCVCACVCLWESHRNREKRQAHCLQSVCVCTWSAALMNPHTANKLTL